MQFSHSRLSKYKFCPRAWMYSYIENLKEPPTEEMLLGSLFHLMCQEHYTPIFPDTALKEYETAVLSGELDRPLDLLPNVFEMYKAYYAKSDIEEKLLGVELEAVTQIDDTAQSVVNPDGTVTNPDTIIAKIDRLVEYKGLIGIRDTKTTGKALKYTPDDVRYNDQLLLYAAIIEDVHHISIDFIEIDEVRIEALQPVPINKNGKPTADLKRLTLVTYEEYYRVLMSMNLELSPEYQPILVALEQRGHPLFRRTRVSLYDKEILNTSILDTISTYKMIKTVLDDPSIGFPRNVSRGCNRCGYKELCKADYFNLDPVDRGIITEKFDERLD